MQKIATYAIVTVLIVALALGIFWGIWQAWCWALPQVYPTGPQALIAPGYWLFVVCWVLTATVGRAIFGGRSSN